MATSINELFNKIESKLADAFRELPAEIGEEAVNFTLENFEAQGWQGDSFEAWPHRKNPNAWGKADDPSRALLVKSGNLRRTIRVLKIEADRVTITAGGEMLLMRACITRAFWGK